MPNSPILDIPLLAASQYDKETTINSMVGYLERAMNSSVTIDMVGGNITVPITDFTRYISYAIDNGGATSVLTVPATVRLFVVDNRLNANILAVNGGAGSANVSAGSICVLHTDGTTMTIVSNSAWTGVDGVVPSKQPNSIHSYWRFRFVTGLADINYAQVTELVLKEDPNGIQLATGGTAIATSTYAAGWEPDKAFDALDNTYWRSVSGQVSISNHAVGYQFASPVAITSIDLKCAANQIDGSQPVTGVVEFSDDGVTWYEAWETGPWSWVDDVTKTNSSTHPLYLGTYSTLPQLTDVNIPVEPNDGQILSWDSFIKRWIVINEGNVGVGPHRYWRVYVTTSNHVFYTNFADIEFRSQAGVKEVNSGGLAFDGGSAASFKAINAFDDNDATYVSLVPREANYVGYDFGAPKMIREVMVQIRSDTDLTPKDFAIEYSDDNVTWLVAYNEVGKSDWTSLEEYIIPIRPAAASGTVPIGGTTGQYLVKTSGSDYDLAWATLAAASTELTLNDQTVSYTLVLTDAGKYVRSNVAAANNLTVPLNSTVAFPIGTVISLRQVGAGQTTVVATGGVTINTAETLKLRKQGSSATLIKVAVDAWDITGDLELAP